MMMMIIIIIIINKYEEQAEINCRMPNETGCAGR
jgi:hypothetical protein